MNINASNGMITFGLTGGIASGKSTASRTFVSHGIPMVDADQVARQVVEPGTYGLQEIINLFGESILLADRTLDRIKLGALVFNNPDLELRQRSMHSLNCLMGPLIQEESTAQIRKLHSQGHPIVGYDAALICEMGNADRYRPLIVVSCPMDTQLARLMSRNGLTRDEAMDRILSQMPLEKRLELADYVIDTSGTVDYSIQQAEEILWKMKSTQEK
jgi:dephospho-CoA kinase